MNEPYSFTFYTASWYRRSPFWQRTVEAGCTSWDLYNHMLIPTLYDDDEAEYWHLVNHVTLWDVAVERQVEIVGPDATAFTQLLTCRDLSRCEVLQCKYAPIIAPHGGIVNDPILLRLGDDRFWLSTADSDALLYALGVQAFAGLDVSIREPDVSPLHVTGMERLVEPGVDHIGREALERITSQGVDRKLVGVEIGGEPFRLWLEEFWAVRHRGDTVGRLTSASYSFRLKRNIGYAWVPIELAAPGNEVEVLSPDGPVPAVTAALPFLDVNKDIPVS
jgi:glycine cleavage system aminomethyltransferase T